MEIKSYRDLKVWQRAMEIAEETYKLTACFPKEEMYGLVSQMRRASVSIASNLAEGSARRTRGEYIRFVNIASGSVAELETQLMLSLRLNFLSEKEISKLHLQLEEAGKMLYALYRSLSEREAA